MRGRSNAWRPAANSSTKRAIITASRVLPAAMPSEVATEPAVLRFTTNAPMVTDGQTHAPQSSSEASAMPVGGHTGLALACTEVKSSPSLPATM